MVKYLVLAAAAFTTLMAILVAITGFTPTQLAANGMLWTLARVVVCLLVVGIGLVTWIHLRRGGYVVTEWVTLLGAMALLVVGAFGAAWAIHMGEATGDYEYWVMMIDMALIAQGALTILCLWTRRRPASG